MVLTQKERKLMDVVYEIASSSNEGKCLVTPFELLTKIPYTVDFRKNDLEDVMNQLVLDNYFEYDKARKTNGDIMYVITLKDNGISYLRDRQVARRKLAFRIAITVILAIFSFSIKSILDLITKG
ncbi:MAG: hypothetical protein K5765_02285 [Clostridia bacterium]|nr:hypothetical protein [Clostridia bacterium]